ncbi:sensor histidine kinase [Granulicella tundricola]|uniref:histidine kinase n=1 Tax=Granulicella tundricola (strain ATCC BAA-1859 / DSM 23138 / MP5ACTX9) TaxID=1198114 RepID=E8WZV5_GRATM|nr:sensor histidine kinase [Granulicella tundricola]ADW67766.1 histidine kinase [Granulicella tundricola MP5ACTX9]
MKRQANRKVTVILLSVAILIVALNARFAFVSVKELLQSEYWVQHTWQVINQVERIMGSAKDAESGARGFVITGKEQNLEFYNSAQVELPQELKTFSSLTGDNPSQQARITEMQAVLEQRMATLAEVIELRRANDVESTHAFIQNGTGRIQMDHLRAIADQMEQEEQRLLVIRTATATSSSHRALFSIALASGLDMLLIVLMFRYFAHERSLRIATEEAADRLAIAHAETEARAEEIRQLNATLEERVRQRTAELESTNRELEAFSYSVSHDLRSPLRTIDGFSLALEEDYANEVDATGRDYIRRVRSGVQRMGQLIDALLQLSRITRAEISREDVNVSAIARSIVADIQEADLAQKVSGHGVLFTVQDGLTADADPKLLQVALENLLGNAVKFSSKVEHPSVQFGWDEGQKAYFVRDNGAGFDMYYADKLFNAFNRLHGDKDFKGSGIGLATVARVVRRHHGRIWADSAVDHGATFFFTLG